MIKYVPEYLLLGESLGLYNDPHHSPKEQRVSLTVSFKSINWTEMHMESYIYGLISDSLLPEAPGPD